LPRLHAIWALGQFVRHVRGVGGKSIPVEVLPVVATLRGLLQDKDSEIRAQTARVYGEFPNYGTDVLIPLLKDQEPRVRQLAAQAIGWSGRPTRLTDAESAIQFILDMLRDNADKDPYLRHAGVMALARVASPADLSGQARRDVPPSVRMGILLAMRRQGTRSIARFLRDSEPRLVLEATRAIHDVPILDALPELASLTVSRPNLPSVALHRALNAHFRLGLANNAAAVAAFAAKSDAADK